MAAARKAKVTVSIDEELLAEVDELGRRLGKPRSRLVEEGLVLLRRNELHEQLRQGYRAMSEENVSLAEESLGAWWEDSQ